MADVAACEVHGGLAHPGLRLAPNAGQLDVAGPLRDGPEGGARLDGLKLFGVADENDLGVTPLRLREHPPELARTDHPGLVDHQNVVAPQQVLA